MNTSRTQMSEKPGVIVNDAQVEIRYVVPTGPKGETTPFCHLRLDYLIVEWDAKESSCMSCGSVRNVWIVERKKGRMSYPAGVHVGVRMDTGGDPTGPAGSYQGTLTMRYVPYEQWNSVFFAKYLDCE